jgi:acetylornithine deacetylase/succinyl-diaminopimelate desuccinylase family protein
MIPDDFPKYVHAFLSTYRRDMIALTSELIAIATENPPGSHYAECRRFLLARLKRLGFSTQVHGECILARTKSATAGRTLYFHGHYDVVPAQSREQFKPVLKGGNLFGRGSSDMKSGLVAMIYAAKPLEECSAGLNGGVTLVLVPDEETSGPRGSKALLRAGLLGRNAIGMLTAEPTGGVIWNANNGAISLRVTVPGKHAHVSLQHLGVNAFENTLKIAPRLLAFKRKVERRAGSVMLIGGRAEGGATFNAVPGEFSFTIDRRITPKEDLQQERQKLLDFLSTALPNAQMEVLQEGASASTPASDPLSRALAESVFQVTKERPKFELLHGLLETRYYTSQGIPALAYGPGLLTVSHGPNEFVPVRNIEQCAAVYALTAQKLFQHG